MAQNGPEYRRDHAAVRRVSLSNPQTSPQGVHSDERFPAGWPTRTRWRSRLLQISEETGVDISFHVDTLYSQNRRLVVFDMDSTLVQAEVINLLAEKAGASEKVVQITEAAMNGQMDFKESLARRVAVARGAFRKKCSPRSLQISS